MPPPERYPSPAKQMLELGRQARSEGLSFEEFWERAVRPGQPVLTPRRIGKGIYADLVGAIVWPSSTAERMEAQEIIASCKATWERAYNLEPPTPNEEKVARLYAIWAERELAAGRNDSRAELPLAVA